MSAHQRRFLLLFWVLTVAVSRTAHAEHSGPVARPPVSSPAAGAEGNALQEGYRAYQDGRIAEAARWYRRAAEQQPDDLSIQYDLGCLLARTGDIEGAVSILKRVSEQRPTAEIQDALGQVYEQSGQLEPARDSYAAAVQLAPENPKYLWRQARMLLRMNQPEAAKPILIQLLTIEPADAQARYHLGELDLRAGQADLAIHEFRQAVESHPEHLMAWNGLAVAYTRVGALADAEMALQHANRLDPEDPHTRTNAGLLAAAQQHFDEARSLWQSVLKENPDFAPALENLRKLDNPRNPG